MVSCAAKLFHRKGRDETFEAKKRVISMYGKYGGGVWRSGTNFERLRSVAPHPAIVVPDKRQRRSGTTVEDIARPTPSRRQARTDSRRRGWCGSRRVWSGRV